MPKKTDGRAWLTVPQRKAMTEFRDAAWWLARVGDDTDSRHFIQASARYIEASQALCRLLADQTTSIRSLNRSLEHAKRRELRLGKLIARLSHLHGAIP